MHVTIEKKLKQYLGLEDRDSEIRAISQKVVVPDENILRHFGSDTRSIYVAEEPWKYDESTGVYVDQWGIGYKENCKLYTNALPQRHRATERRFQNGFSL